MPCPAELAPAPDNQDEVEDDDDGQNNPTYGELVENLEEEYEEQPVDNSDTQNMQDDLDQLMNEIQEELVPPGEEEVTGENKIEEAGTLVEDVEGDEEQEDEPEEDEPRSSG